MIYGLVGSSGTGKTTLATMVAEAMGVKFLQTSITKSARRHGFDPVARLNLNDRIELQFHLLSDMIELIDKCTEPAILDRTPIDLIAYMLCEIHMHSHLEASPEQLARVSRYVDLCMRTASLKFDHMFLLSILPTYEVTSTRPALNPAYQVHTQMVMYGTLNILEGVGVSFLEVSDLNTRLDHVMGMIEKRMNTIQKQLSSSPHIH